jgi:hypothetical protein
LFFYRKLLALKTIIARRAKMTVSVTSTHPKKICWWNAETEDVFFNKMKQVKNSH